MKNKADLQQILRRIDHRGYPAYKDTAGSYQFEDFVLSIDHVQGDPFASPSKLSVHVLGKAAGFPKDILDRLYTKTALEDLLLRAFGKEIERFSFKARGSGKSGLIGVSRPGQEILRRSACELDVKSGNLTVRFEVGFPANGRTINAMELDKILFQFLPECVRKTLFYKSWDKQKIQQVKELSQDQHEIRMELEKRGLAAFVGNGSILPRESGISDKPMKQAVTFQSPESMEITLDLPNKGKLSGMGIPKGVTLIVGGGYHGKSTLLKALERGVYDHIAGDGREYVITDASAVKIRAEDGRSIKNTDISMFINGLPNQKDTAAFQTEDASGSTSQAANVVEAMEAGTKLLLIDEDTSATNFMIRDELMARVVHAKMEPITPFIDRVEDLYEKYGISTILVAGSCGTYFQKAGRVVQMMQYQPMEITQKAKAEADKYFAVESEKREIRSYQLPDFSKRVFGLDKKMAEKDRIKIKGMGKDAVSVDKDTVELRYVEQLADSEQAMALGYMLKYAKQHLFNGKNTMQQAVDAIEHIIEEKGIGAVCESRYLSSNLAVPRRQEIFACFNRCRTLHGKNGKGA